MRSLSISMIVLNLMFSMNSHGLNDLDDEARAKAELQAQETAMAEAQKQFATPAPAAVQVKIPDPEVPKVEPVAENQNLCGIAPPNNLTLFKNSLQLSQKMNSLFFPSRTPYRMNWKFFERLGAEEGSVFKCPIKDHGFHFMGNYNGGLVLTDKGTKHIDLPPLSRMAAEARDYVLSLTQRENLEIHMWTRGYVITEAETGLVLTVEIKD
jgi:hypothetical protein